MLPNWRYYKKITIDHTKVDSDLTDFPVMVKLNSSNFDFSKSQTNGNDIRFVLLDGTLLKYERDLHDSTNQKAVYWVKIPAVSSIADTVFKLYFGNPVVGDGVDPTNVWDNEFVMVQHMNDNPDTSHIKDSTINGNNGTKYTSGQPIEVDGLFSKAQSFDGSNDYINCNLNGLSSLSTEITVEFIAKPIVTALTVIIIANPDHSNNRICVTLPWENRIYWDYGDITSTGRLYVAFNADWFNITANWVFISGIEGQKIYRNNVLIASSANYSTFTRGTKTLDVARYISGPTFWQGFIDETRFSNIARSTTYVKANDYNLRLNTLLNYSTIKVNTNTNSFFSSNF